MCLMFTHLYDTLWVHFPVHVFWTLIIFSWYISFNDIISSWLLCTYAVQFLFKGYLYYLKSVLTCQVCQLTITVNLKELIFYNILYIFVKEH